MLSTCAHCFQQQPSRFTSICWFADPLLLPACPMQRHNAHSATVFRAAQQPACCHVNAHSHCCLAPRPPCPQAQAQRCLAARCPSPSTQHLVNGPVAWAFSTPHTHHCTYSHPGGAACPRMYACHISQPPPSSPQHNNQATSAVPALTVPAAHPQLLAPWDLVHTWVKPAVLPATNPTYAAGWCWLG
jgi:hypothetical protein